MRRNYQTIPSRPGKPPASASRSPSRRRGAVLLIVLVTLMLLALGVYSFTELSLAEAEATAMFGRGVHTRAFADSGVEYAAVLLSSPDEDFPGNYYDRPEFFQGVLLEDSETSYGRGGFSIVSAVENDASASRVRYGLIDESARLNLNALVKLGLDEIKSRDVLLNIPGMNFDTADAILDWIDNDDKIRTHGAESIDYESLSPPYSARNGPLESLDELLLVQGVTPELLYGEDVNRNGLFDANEDQNGDGSFQPGWSQYLTVISRESNLRADGSKRIDLNQDQLGELFDQIEKEYDEETAKFIVAYRISGVKGESREKKEAEETAQGGQNAASQGKTAFSASQPASSGDQEQPASSNQRGSQNRPGGGNTRSGNQRGNPSNGETSGQKKPKVERAGIDLSAGGSVKFNSLFDLVDVTVEVTISGTKTELESQWTSKSGAMEKYLPLLFDTLTTNSEEFIEGRININQAPLEVILGIPEMTEILANSIVSSRMIGPDGTAPSSVDEAQATVGWLLTNRLVDLEAIRKLEKYITTRGDVYRVQVLGYYEAGGPYSRVEAIIDVTGKTPKIVFQRELSDLGKGFPKQPLSLPESAF